MVQQDRDEMRMRCAAYVECVQLDNPKNEFAQQRRYSYYAASVRQRFIEARQQIKRSERHWPRHLHRMARARGNPYAAISRHHPRAVGRPHRHHASRGVKKLMPRMRMRSNQMSVRVLGHDSGADLGLPGVKKPVAFFRHQLAIYRKMATRS